MSTQISTVTTQHKQQPNSNVFHPIEQIERSPAATLEEVVGLRNQGHITQATALCRGAVAKHNKHVGLRTMLGVMAMQQKNPELALESFHIAISLRPDDATLYVHKARALQGLRDANAALLSLEQAQKLAPQLAIAWFEYALLLERIFRYEESLVAYDHLLTLTPLDEKVHPNRGNVLNFLFRPHDALLSYERALAIKPESLIVQVNQAATLQKVGCYDAALDLYAQVLLIKPDHVDAIANRGNVYFLLKRYDKAMECYSHAQAINPAHVGANFNESLCQLLLGNFDIGWRKYEWRWQTKQLVRAKRKFQQPIWLGYESLQGKTILLHAEQGLGDTIQFCRYAAWVQSLGAIVLLEVQATLKTLLSDLAGINAIYAQGETLPNFDFHCPLLSIPLMHRTTASTIPVYSQYIVARDAPREKWKGRLASEKRKIGIVCSGSKSHVDDLQRSISLERFVKALSEKGELFCLQKELRPADLEFIGLHKDVHYFGNELLDFSDTAGIVDAMDVIVTVDTSVAHLAAAMGKKVFILLPFSPDWRWLLERVDSPWYPTMRLFRQPTFGDWDAVLKQIVEFLDNDLN